MNVLVVEPGVLPYEKEVPDELKDLQAIVGGNIQAIYPFREAVALVCNEDGIGLHLEFNRTIPERQYGAILGTFFICGLKGDSFSSLTPEQVETYKERFKKAEVLLAISGGTPLIAKVDARPKHPPEKPSLPTKKPTR